MKSNPPWYQRQGGCSNSNKVEKVAIAKKQQQATASSRQQAAAATASCKLQTKLSSGGNYASSALQRS